MPGCNPTFGPTCIFIVDYYLSIGLNFSVNLYFVLKFAILHFQKDIEGVVTFTVDNE